MTPRAPSSHPPFGTESRWLPTMTVFDEAPRKRHPVVAGRIGLDLETERRHFFPEPLARVAPHRPPREALRAVGRRRARGKLAQVGDHSCGVHGASS